LTISKRLAQMLGGDVTLVETRPGAGTRFRVTVAAGPLDGVRLIDAQSPATALAAKHVVALPVTEKGDAPALQGCRILLAEDGVDNQRLISFILKKAGADATLAENGKIALDAVLAAARAGQPFDVVLMDMQMHVMDGYEATRQLRARGCVQPIIALTAHAMEQDRQKCLDAGCDDYASKPVNRPALLEKIRRWVRAASPASRRLPKRTALVDRPA